MLKKAEILRLKQVDHIISENTILSNINHPFLIKMVGFAQDERYLYFVLEYVQGGELFTYLRNKGKLESNEAQLEIILLIFLDFTAAKSCSCLNTSTQKISFTGTWNQKICSLPLTDT